MSTHQDFRWTQPICDDCWDHNYPKRPSPRTATGFAEQCCKCGQGTHSGIYVRVDPAKVPYPSLLK